ncbi:MAG TPA: hypothetical protein VMU22_12310 [Rhizomicrobium sp.]|nr:hypothetical protein [Rhizomicrobium sp.]
MQELEQLKKQWNDGARFRGIQASLCLEGNGLTLGAGTVVAKRNRDGSLALEDEEARILTLLSVAYEGPVDPSVLKTIRRASAIARDGDECVAAMHIALAKLPKISDPIEAARRLFIADGLIGAGVTPCDIWELLEFDPSVLRSLSKYDQDEPRVPAGSGKPSGEWTSGGGGGTAAADVSAATAQDALAASAARAAEVADQDVETQVPRILSRLPGIALRLARIAARLNLPLSALIETLRASPTGGEHLAGSIRGFPGLQYSRHQDESGLNIVTRSGDQTVLTLYPRGKGRFANAEEGVIAEMEGDELVLQAMPGPASQPTKEPDLCPEPPGPDKPGMTGLAV